MSCTIASCSDTLHQQVRAVAGCMHEYQMALLQTMKLTSAASLLLGLLFGIIVILFVVISILLIYSLLMIFCRNEDIRKWSFTAYRTQ